MVNVAMLGGFVAPPQRDRLGAVEPVGAAERGVLSRVELIQPAYAFGAGFARAFGHSVVAALAVGSIQKNSTEPALHLTFAQIGFIRLTVEQAAEHGVESERPFATRHDQTFVDICSGDRRGVMRCTGHGLFLFQLVRRRFVRLR